MSIYLGQLGRLVELKCPATQQVQPEDRYTFETTIEGAVKAQVRPVGRRVWSLGTSDATKPAEQATIQAFADGAWGPGPFVFVSADAPVTNMLTPAAASCLERSDLSNIKPGGPVDLGADGWAGSSIRSLAPQDSSNGSEIYLGADQTPVLPGIPVTGSAWVRGDGARVRLYWYGPDSWTIVGASNSSTVTLADGWKRLSVTATPPAGAAGVRVLAQYADWATLGAITWTDAPFDWAAGEGCPKSVLHAMSKTLVLASRDPRGGRYANLGFTITEVG